ncbi:hypothetical protein FMUAM8_02050 [Nocardia cyriacigeorgica]|nr:hypothetical protein FMUAM8_02050 [Nocardia cyriacigeorgica]
MKVLGVVVSAGVLYYGALDASVGTAAFRATAGAPGRLVPAAGLAGANRLADTFLRITQDIRVLEPDAVVLVGTRKHSQWKYRDAVERISLISALILSCTQLDVRYEELTTERIGKALGIPPASLDSFRHERIGMLQKPPYWASGRAIAFAAAMAYITNGSEG